MKRLTLILSLLLALFATAPLFAVDNSQRPTLAQDVIRLTQAGVDDSAIMAFVKNRRGTYTVTADEMIAMSEARVSKDVLDAVATGAASRDQSWRDGNGQAESADQPAETRTTETVYVPAPRVYYDPWYYWDPWWYGPRLSLNLGFGFGGYYGYHPYRGGYYGGHSGGGHPGGGRPGGGHPGGGHRGGGRH